MNNQEIRQAIESCTARRNCFQADYMRDISDGHREKLVRQIQTEQVKIDALEQQISMKVNNYKMVKLFKYESGSCPVCGKTVSQNTLDKELYGSLYVQYCSHCGKAIYFKEEENERD